LRLHAQRRQQGAALAAGVAPSGRLRSESASWRHQHSRRLKDALSDLNLPEGATPAASDGTLLPPLRVQAQLVPGVLVVDIGIAQRLLKMPGQVSRLLIGKARGKRTALESVVGDKLRLIEPDAEAISNV